MTHQRKRFWMYVRLAIFFAVVTAFFVYSLVEMIRMASEGFLSEGWDRTEWYHPAVFWNGGFANLYTSIFGFGDPAACASATTNTIWLGLAFFALLTEAMIIMAGREWFARQENRKADKEIESGTAAKPPWYLATYIVVLGAPMSLGTLAAVAVILLTFGVRSSQYAVAFSLSLVLLGIVGFVILCLVGLWKMKSWGFWGLVGALLFAVLLGIRSSSPLVVQMVNVGWLTLLLLVVFVGGANAVWEKLE